MSQQHFIVAKKILILLEKSGFPSMFAGGCVRDTLLGIPPKDYDIATKAKPEDVQKTFKKAGYKVIPTGIDHGTVTVVHNKIPVEVTTLRKDVQTDGRHAVVNFEGADFRDDAERRDFTINAMFMNVDKDVTDFFSGREDLQKKLLRFVGDAEARIQEDYLRILRFFRFLARFAMTPDQNALDAIRKYKDGLNKVSQERVTAELLQTLEIEDPNSILRLMDQTGTLKIALPHTSLDRLQACSFIAQKNRAIAHLATLIAENTDITSFGKKLRLSNKQITALKLLRDPDGLLTAPQHSQAEQMEIIDHVEFEAGEGSFLNLFTPFVTKFHPQHSERVSKLAATERQKGSLRKTKVPISGNDVMEELNLEEGERLGNILKSLKKSFRNEQWKTKREGLDRAREINYILTS